MSELKPGDRVRHASVLSDGEVGVVTATEGTTNAWVKWPGVRWPAMHPIVNLIPVYPTHEPETNGGDHG